MLTRTQCEELVRSQQKELNELKAELNFITNKSVKDAVKNRIAFLEDNIYRYKLQIKAFERNGKGLETEPLFYCKKL